jgi:hypothetical protein
MKEPWSNVLQVTEAGKLAKVVDAAGWGRLFKVKVRWAVRKFQCPDRCSSTSKIASHIFSLKILCNCPGIRWRQKKCVTSLVISPFQRWFLESFILTLFCETWSRVACEIFLLP